MTVEWDFLYSYAVLDRRKRHPYDSRYIGGKVFRGWRKPQKRRHRQRSMRLYR